MVLTALFSIDINDWIDAIMELFGGFLTIIFGGFLFVLASVVILSVAVGVSWLIGAVWELLEKTITGYGCQSRRRLE
jgi:hypothetical protein